MRGKVVFSVHLYSAVIHVDSRMLSALVEDDGEREEGTGRRQRKGGYTVSMFLETGQIKMAAGGIAKAML